MAVSRLDHIYRSVLLTKFFTRGWGKPNHLEQIIKLRKVIGRRETNEEYLKTPASVIKITKEEQQEDAVLLSGEFNSPILRFLDDDIIPPEVQTSHFQAILPKAWTSQSEQFRPLVLQFAGTGDHYYWRRRGLMAVPMLRERGVGSIIIENPYYGLRKPRKQLRSSLFYVSDLFIMGAALILESQVLMKWCQEQGYSPLVFHGISMGGHMASLSAAACHHPVGLVPCLAATSGSVTFCQGVMSGAINWKQLEQQLSKDPDYLTKVWPLVHSPENYPHPEKLTASHFMRCLMDECTHIANYSSPVDTELVDMVTAEYDAYQPGHGVTPPETLYPGCRSTVISEGHIRSYLLYQNVFRQAIYRVIDRMLDKYKNRVHVVN